MPIDIYALLKAHGNTIKEIMCETAEPGGQTLEDGTVCEFDKTPHFHFSVLNNVSNQEVRIVVNVRSEAKNTNPNLLCYINKDFKHEITNKLNKLNYSYHQFDFDADQRKQSGIALDYYRMGLFDLNNIKSLFKEIPTTSARENLNDDIYEFLMGIKEKNADIYIFGDAYPRQSPRGASRDKKLKLMESNGLEGFHDIHMNQGNTGKQKWIDDNGIFQDGALLAYFKEDNRWVAVFTRFQTQCWEINQEGNCN
ncbi:hypothetical protein BACCIP111899_02255 [Bacillus rhizoplanae]|uniref:Uncharacterized protein n=1 Tax=Bacillus rhizoplanae TaxID=2880966 RepID=A0ABM8YBB1_9BACI|nr:DUF2278 family protein [Bacillus rhizoplanae]CAG9613060.1 hypothetical protein BACCIP111899_02255 [Bacillus rhizoplanae]